MIALHFKFRLFLLNRLFGYAIELICSTIRIVVARAGLSSCCIRNTQASLWRLRSVIQLMLGCVVDERRTRNRGIRLIAESNCVVALSRCMTRILYGSIRAAICGICCSISRLSCSKIESIIICTRTHACHTGSHCCNCQNASCNFLIFVIT